MRITVTTRDELYERAVVNVPSNGPVQPCMDKVDLCREAIKIATFVRVQAGKRLAAMGAAGREMSEVPRRLAAPFRRASQ